MGVNYTKTNWQNAPNTSSPINAANLNKMEATIYSLAEFSKGFMHKTLSSGLFCLAIPTNLNTHYIIRGRMTLVRNSLGVYMGSIAINDADLRWNLGNALAFIRCYFDENVYHVKMDSPLMQTGYSFVEQSDGNYTFEVQAKAIETTGTSYDVTQAMGTIEAEILVWCLGGLG